MILQNLAQTAFQSSILFLVIWIVFRCIPSFPANSKAWIWRLAFLKPIAGLLPFAAVTLHILAPSPALPTPDEVTVPVSQIAQSAFQATTSMTLAAKAPEPAVDPLLFLWMIGAAGIAGWALISRLQAAKIVRNAEPVSNQTIRNVLDNLLSKANLSTEISLLQSSEVESAMLFGGRRNMVVLPTTCKDSDEIRMMLAHEVAHIARRDLAWQTITWIVRCLFFFNPIVWLAVRSSQLDHESATDRYACELADVPVQTYAEMLLRITVVTRNSLVPGALSVGESYRSIHRRLEAMNHFNTKPNPMRKTAVGLVALATIGLIPMYQFAQAQSDQSMDAKQKISSTRKKSKQAPKQAQPLTEAERIALTSKGQLVDATVQIAPRPGRSVEPREARTTDITPRPGRSIEPQLVDATVQIAPRPGSSIEPQQARSADIAPRPGRSVESREARAADAIAPSSSRSVEPRDARTPREVDPRQAQSDPFARRARSDIAPRQADSAIRTAPSDPFFSASVTPLEVKSFDGGKLVSFKFENVDVRQAIIALFKTTNRSFLLGDGVKGMINVSGQNVPFDQALAEIVKAAKIESYTEGGVIHFTGKKD